MGRALSGCPFGCNSLFIFMQVAETSQKLAHIFFSTPGCKGFFSSVHHASLQPPIYRVTEKVHNAIPKNVLPDQSLLLCLPLSSRTAQKHSWNTQLCHISANLSHPAVLTSNAICTAQLSYSFFTYANRGFTITTLPNNLYVPTGFLMLDGKYY